MMVGPGRYGNLSLVAGNPISMVGPMVFRVVLIRFCNNSQNFEQKDHENQKQVDHSYSHDRNQQTVFDQTTPRSSSFAERGHSPGPA